MSDIKTFKEHWEKIADIAPGGQGTTFKAFNKSDKSVIGAVKVLNKQNDPERRARMQRETTALNTLKHPNIPQVIDFNTEYWEQLEYKLFLCTEFIPGSTLSTFDLSGVPFEEKVSLTIKITEVINYCHQRGIIHRDIKPDNIILKNDKLSEPVIIDFGISFNFNENDDDNLTADGQHLGNRFLILPEQKIGEVGKRDFRTDVSCIVGLLYYFFTGEPPTVAIDEQSRKPHQREKAKEIINSLPKHQRDQINFIFDVGFNQIIDKRWQSPQALIDQLQILKNAQPINIESGDDIITAIKNASQKSDYQEARLIRRLYEEVNENALIVLKELRRDLGEDWGTSQSGGIIESKLEYQNMLSFVNMVDNKLSTNTTIYAFITGSELVIQLTERTDIIDGSSQVLGLQKQRIDTIEVFRQPITGDLNWQQFRLALRNHYLGVIGKKM